MHVEGGCPLVPVWSELIHLLLEQDQFLLTTHSKPDGDGIGSAVALGELLAQMGKRVEFAFPDPAPSVYEFLLSSTLTDPSQLDQKEGWVLVLLDVHRPSRIAPLDLWAEENSWQVVCIDHHPQVEDYGQIQVIDPTAPAVGELIYQLYQQLHFPLTPRAAEGLYVSTWCDTGGFMHSCADGRAFALAQRCVEAGANPDELSRRLRQGLTTSQLKLVGQSYSRIDSYAEGQIVVQSFCHEEVQKMVAETGGKEFELDVLHQINKRISGALCTAILWEEQPGKIRVSSRSQPGVDVGKIMALLGGGGHPQAAGACWAGPLPELKKHFLDLMAVELKERFSRSSAPSSFSLGKQSEL